MMGVGNLELKHNTGEEDSRSIRCITGICCESIQHAHNQRVREGSCTLMELLLCGDLS